MIVIPGGSFMMGSPVTQSGHTRYEQPQHKVTITEPFAVSKFLVTFEEWDACAAYGDCNPHVSDSGWGRAQQPVVNVTWDDAQRYARWLSTITGKTYRLLSEAEYEYSARAGTTTAYPWGDEVEVNSTAMANCNGCGSRWDNIQTAPVGSFAPNVFGLYDMIGNVSEWVGDCLHNTYDGAPNDGSMWIVGGDCGLRVGRGGYFSAPPTGIRTAARYRDPIGFSGSFVGFRVARTLTAEAPPPSGR
jgi:formylglycine-generating enzyme required for sulfatase activity